jgi:ubiquinone/menaquinone biosynthesis C-methylase UbiE
VNPATHADQLRQEFNRWAEAGRGEGMEREHLPITLPVLELMCLAPDDHVLDAGCGNGWLCRLIASRLPRGRVAGMDISDEMVRRAAQASASMSNVRFFTGTIEAIPQPDRVFTKVISVESAYYWPDPGRGLREVNRVLAPGGSAWILINYYRDNPHCHQWGPLLAVPTHLLSSQEWTRLLRQAGFRDVTHQRIPDPSPVPDVYTGRWFRDAAQLREFKREGALLLTGTKP